MELEIAATRAAFAAGPGVVRQLYLMSYRYVDSSATLLIGVRLIGAALVLGIPTILMGGTLPVLLAPLSGGWHTWSSRWTFLCSEYAGSRRRYNFAGFF